MPKQQRRLEGLGPLGLPISTRPRRRIYPLRLAAPEVPPRSGLATTDPERGRGVPKLQQDDEVAEDLEIIVAERAEIQPTRA
jgi:hypothetical protein